ncbi:MAG TPA: hypothetical protein VIB39_01040 [Candidatus Angelobacter sp.]|jgi:hypothetical protein
MLLTNYALECLETGRLITRMDARVKGDLNVACKALQADFLAGTQHGRVKPDWLSSLYNLGSLLQYQCGEHARAEHLCRHILSICTTLAEDPEWAAAMVQPWINCARLAAAEGQTRRSLEILQGVSRFAEGKDDLRIGDFRLHVSISANLFASVRDLPIVCRNVYLTDSARAYFLGADYQGLLAFLESLQAEPFYNGNQGNAYAFLEIKARALLALERYEEAMGTLTDLAARIKSARQRVYPAIYALIADACRHCNAMGDAEQLLSFANKLVHQVVSRSGSASITSCHHLYLIVLSQLRAGDQEGAFSNARELLKTARALHDEVLQMKALMIILAIGIATGPTEQVGLYAGELERAASASQYRIEKALAYVCLAELAECGEPALRKLLPKSEASFSRGLALLRTMGAVHLQAFTKRLLQTYPAALRQRSADNVECSSETLEQTYALLANYVPPQCAVQRFAQGA